MKRSIIFAIIGMALTLTGAFVAILSNGNSEAEAKNTSTQTYNQPTESKQPIPFIDFRSTFESNPMSIQVTINNKPSLIIAGKNTLPWFEIYDKNKNKLYSKKVLEPFTRLYTTSIRGITDLLICSIGGTLGVSHLELISINNNGETVTLANNSNFDFMKYATNVEIVDTTNKISVTYTPAGTRLRYRADILWDSIKNSFAETEPINITNIDPVPLIDKTIFFALNPVDYKIHYYVDGKTIDSVTLRSGTKLLIKKDTVITDTDVAFSYWSNETDRSIINVEFVNGDFLVSAKQPGTTKLAIFKPHNAPTVGKLLITVE